MGMAAERRNWRSAAACRSCDPDLFFPVSSSGLSLEQVAEAKAICARCPVRPQCLAFALRARQAHGVWGGTSEQERYLLWGRDERRIDPDAGKGSPHRVPTDDSRAWKRS
jgi:WhiB family transcriptional regulator, redox-sensing transcriptional regulator